MKMNKLVREKSLRTHTHKRAHMLISHNKKTLKNTDYHTTENLDPGSHVELL